jgi:hypothetical protein
MIETTNTFPELITKPIPKHTHELGSKQSSLHSTNLDIINLRESFED